MGKKIYWKKSVLGWRKEYDIQINLEDLEVKLHIEILSDTAIFLLLGVLGRGTGQTPRGCTRPP